MEHRYTVTATERPSEAVIRAMAQQADCSPVELQPLATAIDPEALDRIFESASSPEVRFHCCGAEFAVTDDEVRISGQENENETT